jgi:phenylacetate-CoA ligase
MRKSSAFWEKERAKNALALFHRAAQQVPAYKDFLKKHRVDPTKIKKWEDFQLVPPVHKKNYLRQYPLEKLLWPKALNSPLVWTATSGSTGEPFYFPRYELLDEQYASIIKSFWMNSSHGSFKPTLVIVAFGMGVWIGGLITYRGYEIAARKMGYPISILTPGINKKEIFNALRNLSPHFSQTILVGYAPFVKDILDSAHDEKIDLSKINLRLHFAAEAFNESVRDYLGRVGHIKDIHRDTMNIYGSAEIGAMAFETPFTILTRRTATRRNSASLFSGLFGNAKRTPTLAQYDPRYIAFEALEGEVILSGNNAIPLIRYAIGDRGGALSFKEVWDIGEEHNAELKSSLRESKLNDCLSEFPLVYVYERTDFSTTLYGLQIYPEHIREALIKSPANKWLTGKFTMATSFDKKQNQFLEINLEMKSTGKEVLKKKDVIIKTIVDTLKSVNSEFRELHRFLGKRALPKVIFWPANDPTYFTPGVKQKWVKKI